MKNCDALKCIKKIPIIIVTIFDYMIRFIGWFLLLTIASCSLFFIGANKFFNSSTIEERFMKNPERYNCEESSTKNVKKIKNKDGSIDKVKTKETKIECKIDGKTIYKKHKLSEDFED